MAFYEDMCSEDYIVGLYVEWVHTYRFYELGCVVDMQPGFCVHLAYGFTLRG